MIAPARITPPPPLQRTSPGRGGGEGGHRGPSIRPSVCSPLLGGAARSGMALPLLGPAPDSATWAPGATPLARKQKNPGGNKKRKEGRRRTKRRKFRGRRRRCVERCRHRLGRRC